MTKRIIICISAITILLLPIFTFASPFHENSSIAKGTFHKHRIPCVDRLGKARDIIIYLPSDYFSTDNRYPVLYMQDAQSIFDLDSSYNNNWNVNGAIDSFMQSGKHSGVIVVGINNTSNRNHEYIPWEFMFSLMGGLGDEYASFIVNTVKPFVDNHYRTKPQREFTGIGGSSFGGLISFYTGLQYQETFGIIGAFSPSFWTKDFEALRYVDKQTMKYDMRIYLDSGTNEWSFASQNREVYLKLIEKGFRSDHIYLLADPQGKHNVASWRRRFPKAFLWLYK